MSVGWLIDIVAHAPSLKKLSLASSSTVFFRQLSLNACRLEDLQELHIAAVRLQSGVLERLLTKFAAKFRVLSLGPEIRLKNNEWKSIFGLLRSGFEKLEKISVRRVNEDEPRERLNFVVFSGLDELISDGVDQYFDGRRKSSVLRIQKSVTLIQKFGRVLGVEYQGPDMDQLLEILQQHRIE